MVGRLYHKALDAQDEPAAHRIDERGLQPGTVLLEQLLCERREELHDVKERPLLLDDRVDRDILERDCCAHWNALSLA